LRHARVKKLHQDRSWKDCVSFQELQDQATAARSAPVDTESQETKRWIEMLEKKCRRKLEREKTATPKSTVTRSSADESLGRHRRSSLSTGNPLATSISEMRVPLNNMQVNSIPSKPASSSDHVTSDTPTLDSIIPTVNGVKRKLNDDHSTPCPMPKRPCVTVPSHASIMERTAVIPTTTQPCRDTVSHTKCSTSCTLSSTTIYLPPCLRHTPYVTQTLLSTHSPIALVSRLSHWDRASFTHDRLSRTVSESQAYPGMGKIVLVESKRKEATEEVLKQVMALNQGDFQERVEVWDWRVLEELDAHALASTGRRWFLGATVWDEKSRCSVFVWNRSWV
jgi:DNA ligase-4